MAYPFPSAEWTVQFEQAIKRSDGYAAAAKDWEGDVLLAIEDGGAIYLDLWHGECRAAEYVADGQKGAEFKISAPLANWRKILDGKLDPMQGIMTRQLKLEGNLVKIMKNVRAAQELVKCAVQVPTE